jgi:penicillin-binding protein 1A
MSLPSWALFMQKCYADKSLNISQEDFDRPNRLTININCEDKKTEKDTKESTPEEDIDF